MTHLAGLVVAVILWLIGDAMDKNERKERERQTVEQMRALYLIKDEDR